MDLFVRQSSEFLLENNQGFLSKVPDADLPKMLFLSVNPNKAGGQEKQLSIPSPLEFDGGAIGTGAVVTSEEAIDEGSDSISRILDKFERALEEKQMTCVRRELQLRLLKLSMMQYEGTSNLSTLESNFSDCDDQINNEDEDILEFTEIFEMFGHSIPENIKTLFGRIIASKKIPVRKGSSGYDKKTFFVYAENKIINKICDKLSSEDVFYMYQVLRVSKAVDRDDNIRHLLSQPIDLNALKSVPGLKDIAFYYLILLMMKKQMLNRLYTHKLEFIFDQLKQMLPESDKEKPYIDKILDYLNRYPIASRPPGLCLIFTMNEGREGSQKDVMRVKDLFEKVYTYDVFVKVNPTGEDIKTIATKLKAGRNKFYDSLVVFFMGHGDKTYLKVTNGYIHRRQDLIEPFTQIEWFFKKPKLFFIQACAVKSARKRVSSTSTLEPKAFSAQSDSVGWRAAASQEWQDKYGNYMEVNNINTYADTLISYATMWYQPASRGEEGSLYIDTLVDQLRMFGYKESIENVLRRVHYNVNTVCLQLNDDGIPIDFRQAPYFESSLQKSFVLPYPDTAK